MLRHVLHSLLHHAQHINVYEGKDQPSREGWARVSLQPAEMVDKTSRHDVLVLQAPQISHIN